MKPPNKPLQSLIDSARKAYDPSPPPPETAPVGFATRVAAQSINAPTHIRTADLLERLGWWGLAASAVICFSTFLIHAQQPPPNPFEILVDDQAEITQTVQP